jgi:gliding motility-associated-like protein
MNDKFEEFFKHTFENFEPEMPQGTWEQIDQSVSQYATGSVASAKVVTTYILKALAVTLPLAGAIYLFSNDDFSNQNNTNTLPEAEQALAEHHQNDTALSTMATHNAGVEEPTKTAGSFPSRTENSQNRLSHRLTESKLASSPASSQHSINQSMSQLPAGKQQFDVSGQSLAKIAPSKDQLHFISIKKEWCASEPVDFKGTATGFDRYRWDFDDGQYYDQQSIGVVTHRYDKAGWYNATLIGYRGNATQRYSLRIQVIQPIAYFTVKADEAPVLRFVNQSRNALNYQWDFGDHSAGSAEANPKHRFESEQAAQVRLIAQNGNCSDTFSMEVRPVAAAAENSVQKIPNVFTPNHDGMNDDWGVDYAEGEIKILVLDRAGKKVFESTDADKKWNGNDQSGRECPSGDYYYIITCKSKSEGETSRTGLIKLMR